MSSFFFIYSILLSQGCASSLYFFSKINHTNGCCLFLLEWFCFVFAAIFISITSAFTRKNCFYISIFIVSYSGWSEMGCFENSNSRKSGNLSNIIETKSCENTPKMCENALLYNSDHHSSKSACNFILFLKADTVTFGLSSLCYFFPVSICTNSLVH